MSVTLKAVVQKQRKDGVWPVYIRLTHNRKIGYYKTEKVVNSEGLDGGDIVDQWVLGWCCRLMDRWLMLLNHVDYGEWEIREIIEYVTNAEADVSFSDWAREYVRRLTKEGRERTARDYKCSYMHLERYMGSNEVMFSKLTVTVLNAWIDTMVRAGAKRCKEQYPVCVRLMWRAAIKELNDDEKGLKRIKTNPWDKVRIPKSDESSEQAIPPVKLREFFAMPLPLSRSRLPLMELGRDVARLAFCLGGLYAVDLYELRAADYYDGIIHYRRAKTRYTRKDGAYMEMRVPEMLRPLMEKYKPRWKEKDRLFSFAELYSTEDSFCANANIGIRQICELMGIPKEEDYSIKTFRHTWATIARNNVDGVTMADVAFALNHSSGHPVTEIYVDKDYSPAWRLNEKVIEFVFMTDDPGTKKDTEKLLDTDRISKNNLMKGTVFYRGKCIGRLEDTGFTNKKQIVDRLIEMLPGDVPERAVVQFVIENADKGGMWMYEHQKGKGF